MDIKEDDFPLYQLLVKLNRPGIESAVADFRQACAGGDEEQYRFALGLQGVAANVSLDEIPGFTEEMKNATLLSCLEIFKDVANRGHAGAAFMVQHFAARKLDFS